MNEYINLNLENMENEHICCAIRNPKYQYVIHKKKKWIKNKIKR